MFIEESTTNVLKQSSRWHPTAAEKADVEAALEAAHISFDDLYASPRKNRWCVEISGACASKIARKLNNIAGFWEADGKADELEGQPLALVTFSYERPGFDRFFKTDWFEN